MAFASAMLIYNLVFTVKNFKDLKDTKTRQIASAMTLHAMLCVLMIAFLVLHFYKGNYLL